LTIFSGDKIGLDHRPSMVATSNFAIGPWDEVPPRPGFEVFLYFEDEVRPVQKRALVGFSTW